MFVRYSSIHGHVSTTAFFLILVLFRARDYTTIDCDKKKSAVLNSGASVDITSTRHRTGQLNASPEMVQDISGTTHAWPTRVQCHTKIDCGVPHLLQTEAGFEDFKQLYMPNAPDQILSLSQPVEQQVTCHISGHQHRKAGSLPLARNGSPCF